MLVVCYLDIQIVFNHLFLPKVPPSIETTTGMTMEAKPKNRKRKAAQKGESDESAVKLLKADEDLFQGTGKRKNIVLVVWRPASVAATE